MAVKIPFEKNIDAHKISANCYTRKQFEAYVVNPLDSLCTVDDSGQVYQTMLDKAKSTLDSYTRMMLRLKVKVKTFPNNKIVTKDQVRSVRRILEGYSDNSFPKKTDVVHLVSDSLIATEEYIEQTQSFLSMTQEQWDNTITRDIVCYMQALVDNDSMRSFKDALKKAAIALTKKPEAEVKKENGVSLMNKYK